MRKLIKALLITAIVCIVGGIACITAGMVMGAGWDDLQDAVNNGDFSIVGNYSSSDVETTEGEHYDSTYDDRNSYQGIDSIEVNMRNGSLYVYQGDVTDEVIVERDEEGTKTTVVKDEETLEIENVLGPDYDGVVLLYLPNEVSLKELDIKIGGGRFEMTEAANADEISVDIGGGYGYLGRITAKEFEGSVGAGSMEIEYLDSRNVDIECGIGSLSISQAKGSAEDYNYKIQTGVGTVYVGDDEYTNIGSKAIKNGGAERKMELTCGVGSVSAYFEEY